MKKRPSISIKHVEISSNTYLQVWPFPSNKASSGITEMEVETGLYSPVKTTTLQNQKPQSKRMKMVSFGFVW